MSLILEALRKSEAERRRGQAPDLHAELPPAPLQRRAAIPTWTWLLVVVAMLLFAFWWSRAPVPSRAATATVDAGATADHGVTAAAKLPVVPRLVPSVPATHPVRVPTLPVERTQTMPGPEVVPRPVAIAPEPETIETAPAAAAPVAIAGKGSDILQLSDLSPDERKSLPPLKLSMHLWNEDPARRFVILDGKRLVEGDRIGDAVVTAITTDGVLLDWNGRRLRLSIR